MLFICIRPVLIIICILYKFYAQIFFFYFATDYPIFAIKFIVENILLYELCGCGCGIADVARRVIIMFINVTK